jgi:predicted ATPase
MRPDLPSGTVTFLFTDVEGSTKLLDRLGPAAYAAALAEHRRLIRGAVAAHGGVEVDTQGDAFFVAFPTATGALAAAVAARDGLTSGLLRVRMGIHTGNPNLTDGGYIGSDVHLAARIAAAGYGGQVLVSSATVALTGAAGLLDLGEHRLKDFDQPVPIHQVGNERFPPLRTISNTNLPVPASSFVGRETEVAEICALVQDGARLLTLTGPGGSGKTRLGIAAAATLVPAFRAGVFWVGLAPQRDPALVTEAIAETLGAKDGLAHHIGERAMLLLLDNFEQVVAAAVELAELIEACPNLRLLVTSRELLRVRGEIEFPVLPLAAPEAVELFCERAGTTADDIVRRLCHALDNLPLAVELAAARASVLTPAQILERLSQRLDLLKGGRDADPRQRTLRATIAWSFELLTAEEQRHFAQLAVFAGGWTLAAAEEVAHADLDMVQSLVAKSLVRYTGERFSMLETIREYAAERLEASGEGDELRARHAEYFLALAEEAEPRLLGHEESGEWLDRLGRDHDNIRAAIDHFQGSGRTQSALRLVGAAWIFWRDRAFFAEGRRLVEGALRSDDRPTKARAKALNAAASMAALGGAAATGRSWAEEAFTLHRGLGDESGTAEAQLWLGWAVANDGDWAMAEPMFDEAAHRFHRLGDEDQRLVATCFLAMALSELGHRDRAKALDDENLRRARDLGNQQLEATTLDGQARHALDDGRAQDALSLARQSLSLYDELGDPHGVAIELRRIAIAFAKMGRARLAARLLGSAEALHREIGGTMSWVTKMTAEASRAIREHLDEVELAAEWAQGRALTMDEAVSLAFDPVA